MRWLNPKRPTTWRPSTARTWTARLASPKSRLAIERCPESNPGTAFFARAGVKSLYFGPMSQATDQSTAVNASLVWEQLSVHIDAFVTAWQDAQEPPTLADFVPK